MARLFVTVVVLLLTASSLVFADKKVPTPEEVLRNAGIPLAAEDLTQALRHEDPFVREAAARVIGTRKIAQASAPLKQLLTDEYVFARIAAAEALLRLSDNSGLDVLRKELEQGPTPVTVAAARALLAGGSSAGYPVLLARLQDTASNPRDRVLVVRALPAFRQMPNGESAVRNVLIGVLHKDAAPEVRGAAADELKPFSGPEVTEAFTKVLATETDPVVRGLAEAYLKGKR